MPQRDSFSRLAAKDALLLQGMASFNNEDTDWVRVAAFVCEALGEEDRAVNNKQCLNRYLHKLDPKLAGRRGNSVPWTQREVG